MVYLTIKCSTKGQKDKDKQRKQYTHSMR